ncbi:MAG: hypothetical protein ACJATI_002828 [Halioglobus sp.]|jgi:hypothetical protein
MSNFIFNENDPMKNGTDYSTTLAPFDFANLASVN